MSGHKANKCFKLHGYPSGYKDEGKSKYKAAVNQASALMPLNQEHENKTQVSLTQELYSQLMAMLKPSANQVQNIDSTSDIIPKPSSISYCLSTIKTKCINSLNVPWILDTGATDHMVYSTSFLSSFKS